MGHWGKSDDMIVHEAEVWNPKGCANNSWATVRGERHLSPAESGRPPICFRAGPQLRARGGP